VALISLQRVGQTERAKLDAIGAERIGFDDVRAGAHIFLVHAHHEIRLRRVQRIEALVDEDTLRVEHRAHGAVANEHTLFEASMKGLGISVN